MRIPVVGVQAAYFVNNILIVLKFGHKFVLQIFFHSWLVAIKELVLKPFNLLHKIDEKGYKEFPLWDFLSNASVDI